MYKNIISFFSFRFIIHNVRTGKVKEGRRRLSGTHELTVLMFCEPGPLRSAFRVDISLVIKYSGRPRKFSWSYLLQPATYTLQIDMPPSSMLPTRCTWTRVVLLAWQFTRHFRRWHLFSVNFRYQVPFLLFLFPISVFRSCIDMS